MTKTYHLPALLGILFLPFSLMAQIEPTPPPLTLNPINPPNDSKASSDFNGPISAALDNYEVLSGKHLIRDTTLTQLANIKIDTEGMSQEDALKIYEATLLLNGVAIVPLDATTSKVLNMQQQNKNPRSEGIRLVANADDLPKEDVISSYYMPLKFISSTEAMTIFNDAIPVHAAYGKYTAAPSAQALILTDNTSVIRQLIALKELIDVPAARVTSEFIELKSADSEKVADLLNKLLTKSGGAPGAPPGGPAGNNGGAIVPPNVGTDAPLQNEKDLLSGPAQIVADPRSNRLLVVTRPVNLPLIRKLVAEVDQESVVDLPQKYQLKFVQAADILPALELAAAQTQDDYKNRSSGVNGSTGGGTGTTTPRPTTTSNSSNLSSSSSGGGSDVSSVIPGLADPTQNDSPVISVVGKSRLLADNHSNTILVFGPPDATQRVINMIKELDHKPQQVYLATVIGQLNVSKNSEFGIDILQKFQRVGQGGFATSSINRTGTTTSATVPNPFTLTSSSAFPILSGLNFYGAIGSVLDAYVTALQATSRFKILSRPSVFTSNNKKAVIASGSQVPVPSNSTSGFTGNSNELTTSSSIEYKNVVLELDVIPLINADGQVTLKIRQTNNTLGSSQNIGGNQVPTINTQGINTEVTVPNKSTIVIGGIITDTGKNEINSIPLLGDIPGIGYLFKDTTKSKERDELIIMIQPTVVQDENEIAASYQEQQRSVLGPEAATAATQTVNSSDNSVANRAEKVIGSKGTR